MRNKNYIREKPTEMPELEFPICIKQGESYFRYQADGRFEHIYVKLNGIQHVQTSYSFGKLTWLTDYKQEIKTIVRRHGEISQQDFLNVISRYFDAEYKSFFDEKEAQSETLKPDKNYFPENPILFNSETINTHTDAPF